MTKLKQEKETIMSVLTNKGDYKQLAKTFYEAFNTGDIDSLDQAFTQDWLDHMLPPGRSHGLLGAKETITIVRQAFPDYHITIEEMLVDGDMVAVRLQASGTHLNSFMGIEATGKQVSFYAFDMHRVENNCIVESWHLEDKLSLLHQLKENTAN
jgi:predicted ester cyclase